MLEIRLNSGFPYADFVGVREISQFQCGILDIHEGSLDHAYHAGGC